MPFPPPAPLLVVGLPGVESDAVATATALAVAAATPIGAGGGGCKSFRVHDRYEHPRRRNACNCVEPNMVFHLTSLRISVALSYLLPAVLKDRSCEDANAQIADFVLPPSTTVP